MLHLLLTLSYRLLVDLLDRRWWNRLTWFVSKLQLSCTNKLLSNWINYTSLPGWSNLWCARHVSTNHILFSPVHQRPYNFVLHLFDILYIINLRQQQKCGKPFASRLQVLIWKKHNKQSYCWKFCIIFINHPQNVLHNKIAVGKWFSAKMFQKITKWKITKNASWEHRNDLHFVQTNKDVCRRWNPSDRIVSRLHRRRKLLQRARLLWFVLFQCIPFYHQCADLIKDLIRHLRSDNPNTCAIRRKILDTRVLSNDLVPIMRCFSSDDELFDMTLRFVILLHPFIILFQSLTKSLATGTRSIQQSPTA
jgi:hypothetical protein